MACVLVVFELCCMGVDMSDKNLLVLALGFPDKENKINDGVFIKEQLKYLQKYFDKITVIVPILYVPSFFKNLPIKKFRKYALLKDYSYGNICVHFLKIGHVPKITDYESRAYSGVVRVIEKKGLAFDLIHAHFTYFSGYFGALLKEKYKKPLVLTVHEDAEWLKKEVSSGNEKYLAAWNASDVIIRVSNKDIDLLASKVSRDKIKYICNGFDHELFCYGERALARKELGLNIGEKIVLNIGRLEEQKGQKYLIEAFRNISEKERDARLVIIGSGSLRNELAGMAAGYGLSSRIMFVEGNMKRENIALWMKACDLFVLPSISEGNPTVMFESLGCGIPFIGSDVGGVSSIMVEGITGYVVKPRDVADLTSKLELALKKKWDVKKIFEVSRKYSWKAISEKVGYVYREAMEAQNHEKNQNRVSFTR